MCGCCGPTHNEEHEHGNDQKIETTGKAADPKTTKGLRSTFNAFLKNIGLV